jgi:sodium-independent sulfate anion transporter 11
VALLTGEVVGYFVKEGYSAPIIALAVAFLVGIYSLALGLLKLGFLLDSIALPVLTGYVSAATLTIIFSQIPTIFGDSNIGFSTGGIIHDFSKSCQPRSGRPFWLVYLVY